MKDFYYWCTHKCGDKEVSYLSFMRFDKVLDPIVVKEIDTEDMMRESSPKIISYQYEQTLGSEEKRTGIILETFLYQTQYRKNILGFRLLMDDGSLRCFLI